MKLASYILLCAMLFTGLYRFVESMESQCRHADVAAVMDCCDSHHDCEKKRSGKEHEHMVGIIYHHRSGAQPAPQVIHYGTLTSSYQFETREALFHPPRFS
jgi:hypothetical protein